jgi:hypothetical protein
MYAYVIAVDVFYMPFSRGEREREQKWDSFRRSSTYVEPTALIFYNIVRYLSIFTSFHLLELFVFSARTVC